ncbi:hypothetical protein GS399_11200 [Pedobacter sp. HMF7647]|uniref:Uncharacterized protein n=1 Tax=Hufsiella arboris TaxID=2695275 RepID=A0A7K1YBW7_9SPHI|nr:hypothetical protein [Hufsiella arboris]MXV51538.1 hypothetical protein [Hufsiella arboris]
MKKLILTVFALTALAFSSCKKGPYYEYQTSLFPDPVTDDGTISHDYIASHNDWLCTGIEHGNGKQHRNNQTAMLFKTGLDNPVGKKAYAAKLIEPVDPSFAKDPQYQKIGFKITGKKLLELTLYAENHQTDSYP